MRISEDILRFMTVKVEALEDGPSVMLQRRDRDRDDERGGRDDRPRRRDREDAVVDDAVEEEV